MSRLPIRIKVTLAFTAAMALVLAATGFVVYTRFESSLKTTFDDGLRSRADEVVTLAGPDGSGLGTTAVRRLVERGESFAQFMDAEGRVLSSWPPHLTTPLFDTETVATFARPGTEPKFFDRDRAQGLDDPVRLYVRPIPELRRVVVVGASRDDRDESLQSLAALLLAGGPLALLLASLVGYGAAGVALRPVEEMRRRAADISEFGSSDRLPVPPADDELSRLGSTLNDMLGRVEAALERERGFVADASHELRTPLARLQGELELALRRPRSPEELEAAIRAASAETQRLSRLSEDLLVLARSDRQGLALRRDTVSAGDVAHEVAARYEVDSAAEDGIVVSADRARLEQAVANLVANALEHGTRPIEVTAEAHDGRVELHVRDAGSGFSPAFLPRAFERFSRADAARTGGGAGLGLAIVAAIARAHGGEAHAANRPGGGADVWITLPPVQLPA